MLKIRDILQLSDWGGGGVPSPKNFYQNGGSVLPICGEHVHTSRLLHTRINGVFKKSSVILEVTKKWISQQK